jgi:hypothetical protein
LPESFGKLAKLTRDSNWKRENPVQQSAQIHFQGRKGRQHLISSQNYHILPIFLKSEKVGAIVYEIRKGGRYRFANLKI